MSFVPNAQNEKKSRPLSIQMGSGHFTMIVDYHVHIGPFFGNLMFEPEYVAHILTQLNVDRWVYFSTAFSCEPRNYIAWFQECVERMETAAPGRGIPLLWMNEAMLTQADLYFNHPFRGIKIHEGFEKLSAAARETAFALASAEKCPLVIHTGEHVCCQAGRYDDLCQRYTDICIILAHGRPLNQAMSLLKKHSNVMLDSAFMSPEQMQILANTGLANRVLFGSDLPVQHHFYPHADISALWKEHRNSSASILGKGIDFCMNLDIRNDYLILPR